MRRHRIYTPQPLAVGTSVKLEEQASLHLSKVLRCDQGHPVTLFNGTGGAYHGSIEVIQKKNVSVILDSFIEDNLSSPCESHIAIALSKGDKVELIIQKATELGVSSITPLITEHSDVKLKGERLEKKMRQWQQIAISASEQSGRNLIPEIHPLIDFKAFCQQPFAGSRCMFHPTADSTLSTITKPEKIQLCFGSEGGFSDTEVEWASKQGFYSIALGKRVLRAETAPIAVLGAVNSLWGDWA